MRSVLWCAFLAATTAVSCFAADSPWNGTWKVNEAKSKFTGTTFTYSDKGGGMMHYADGGPVEYDFACDGKEYKPMSDRTFACTKASEMAYATVTKVKGAEVWRSEWTLSADGKTMTRKGSGKAPDGSTTNETTTYTRVSGTKGLVGTWKSTNDTYEGNEVAKISLTGNVMHMEFVSMKESVDAKLDGTPSPVTGPRVPAGVTFEMKPDGPRSFRYVSKLNGKPSGEGVQTISADGKSFTDTSWTIGKTNEKTVAYYEKQ